MNWPVLPCYYLCSSNTVSFYLQNILPEDYNYRVDETKFLENGQFIVRFEIYKFKYDDISSWILKLNQKSKTTYLVSNVRKSELPSVLFKVINYYYVTKVTLSLPSVILSHVPTYVIFIYKL